MSTATTTAATTATATAATGPTEAVVWEPAAGAALRGAVLLLPGRGEHPGVYGRFGRRLAFDGYRVAALPQAPGQLAERVTEARSQLPDGAPVVLAGSDTGALHALASAEAAAPDGLLLVGLPSTELIPQDDELTARTACPAHRGLLDTDPDYRPGALAEPVPAALAQAAGRAAPALPVLLLHGAADPVSPPATAHRHAARLGAELVLVTDGRHDALNDAPHRSVAAAVVQWLERLRGGPHLPAQLTTVTPARTEGAPA
ncbi:alpha/beta hydrolase [Kitasatospora sp. NPDC001664]